MSAANRILKNFNLFVDGRGYAGNCEELQLPSLAIQEEAFRAGGLDSPIGIDLGMEKLEVSFTLTEFSPESLALWGVSEGLNAVFVARGALESLDGSTESVVATMSGRVRSIEPGAWQAGQKATWKFSVSLRAYKYEQNGKIVHDIDVLNMKRVISGVDRLALQRASLGF